MSRELPTRPSLEHLKKQAKALLAEQRRTQPRATLTGAQLALARDYGFSSWAALKRQVDASLRGANPRAALAFAIREGDVKGARALLDAHRELHGMLNEPLPDGAFGEIPLNRAVAQQNREMIDLLLEYGADINAKSDWWAGGFGLLENTNAAFAPTLLERGARLYPNAAAKLGMIDPLRDMVAADPDVVRLRAGDGQTPLHVAANREIADLLLDASADPDALDVDHESTPAQYLVRDHLDVSRHLISRGARTDILLAAAHGDIDRVRRFLDEDPDSVHTTVNSDYFPMRNPRAGGHIYIWTLGGGKTAHAVARDFGHDDVAALLMSRSPDELKLAIACEAGDERAVYKLLAARPELRTSHSAKERGRMADAAGRNNARAVALMLVAGWPVDALGSLGGTALHQAAWLGNLDMVRELIARGAPLEARDTNYDGTPLNWALHGSLHSWRAKEGNYAHVLHQLLDAGAVAPQDIDDLEMSDAARDALERRAAG